MADAERAFRRVLDRQPDHASALYNLGVIAVHDGRSDQAEDVLIKALSLRPDHADSQALLAAVQADLGKSIEALDVAAKLLDNDSADASTLNTAGQVFIAVGDFDQAERAYRTALDVDKGYRPAGLALANLLIARRKFEDAAVVYERMLEHRPTDQAFHLKRAQALWDSGCTAEAREALLNLLDFAPDHVTAHCNLSLFAGSPDPDTLLDRLAMLLSEDDLDPEDRIKAWFAMGNLFAVKQDFEGSLAAFSQGNLERSATAPPTHTHSTEAFEQRVKNIVASPLPEGERKSGSGPTPLMISGPSRSSKSLLQAWLSGHPDISGADETGMLPKLAEQDIAHDPQFLEEAGTAYRESLAQLGGKARYVIDTHPVNSLYLDLLLQICPDAKIIQITRGPLTSRSVFLSGILLPAGIGLIRGLASPTGSKPMKLYTAIGRTGTRSLQASPTRTWFLIRRKFCMTY